MKNIERFLLGSASIANQNDLYQLIDSCNCDEGNKLQLSLIKHLFSHLPIVKCEEPEDAVVQETILVESSDEEPMLQSKASYLKQFNRRDRSLKAERIQRKFKRTHCNISEQDNTSEGDSSDSFDFRDPKIYKPRTGPRIKRPPIANDYKFDRKTGKFACKHCYRKYTTRAKVRVHLHEKHSSDSAPLTKAKDLVFALLGGRTPDNLQCPKCLKFFKSERQLYQHMLYHREKIFCCDMCSARFSFKQGLRYHVTTHILPENRAEKQTVSEKTMCDQCSKLIVKNKMKQHILYKHSDLKPFACPEPSCTSAFKSKKAQKEHHNIHTGAKPFRCEYCPESFHHSSFLRTHRLRHTDPDR